MKKNELIIDPKTMNWEMIRDYILSFGDKNMVFSVKPKKEKVVKEIRNQDLINQIEHSQQQIARGEYVVIKDFDAFIEETLSKSKK
jgi:hypothetical protein